MSNPNFDKFLADLRESDVVPSSDLEALLQANSSREPKVLALALVHSGHLTDWQAKYILGGRRRLRLGSYLLQERIHRDELGDCFLAWHEPLHRQVKLLILSESMIRDSKRRAAANEAIGCLTSLDHPRLEHVYDVGEESGRLFVVFERAQGRLVDPRSLGLLTQGEAAGLLQGVSLGLAFLQARQVVHGELAGAALQLDEIGDGKIVGLCEAVLRRALEGDQALRSDESLQGDRRQWEELGSRVLTRHFRGPEFQAWREWLTESIERPAALEKLAVAIAQWRQEMALAGEPSDLALGREVKSSAALEVPVSDASLQSRESRTVSKTARPTSTSSRKRASSSSTKPKWRTRYQWLVASLVAVVGLGWIVWKGWPAGQESRVTASRELSHSGIEGRLSSASVKKESPSRPPRTDTSSDRESENTAAAESPAGEAELAPTRLEVMPSEQPHESGLITAIDPEKSPVEQSPDLVPPLAELRTKELAEERGPSLARESAASKPAAAQASGEADKSVALPDASSLPSEQSSPSEVDFPSVVSLGEPDAEDKTLFPLPNRNFDELKVELLFDPETVSRSRLFFELLPQRERFAWQVVAKKRPEDTDSQLVGEFKVADGELRFGWAKEVDARSPWLSLRNCFLKIDLAGGETIVTALREPILIEGAKLDAKTLTAAAKVELPGLPNFDSLKIVWGPFGKDGVWAEGLVLNENFESRQPAVLVFRPVWSEQVFGLALERRLRGQIELSVAWVMQTPDKWLPIRQAEMKSVVEASAEAYMQSIGAAELANRLAEDAPYGSKTKMRDQASQAKNRVTELKKRNELLIAHQDKLTEIMAGELPIRIVYPVGERELVLAETATAKAMATVALPTDAEPSSDATKKKGQE